MQKCKATKRNGKPCKQTEELSDDGFCKYHNNDKYRSAAAAKPQETFPVVVSCLCQCCKERHELVVDFTTREQYTGSDLSTLVRFFDGILQDKYTDECKTDGIPSVVDGPLTSLKIDLVM